MYLLPIIGVIGEDFNMNDLLMHLNAAKNEPAIKIIINSPGGFVDVAERMRDAFNKSGKILYSTNSGDVASAAVDIFLSAPKENRTFDPEKGVFLIHMPYLDPKDGGASGTAEEIQAIVDQMKKNDKIMVKSYEKSTGTSANILEGFMKENIPLTPEQVQTLGFATLIKQEFKAVAYYKSNNIDMTNEEVKTKFTILEGLMNKVMAFVRPKALMIQDTNGVELDFGEEIQDPSQIIEGVTATADGSPAEGEYPMPDATILVFVAGALTEIKPAEDEMEALKQENERLKIELAGKVTEFDTFKGEAEKKITDLSTEFVAFRAQFSKGDEDTFGKTNDSELPKSRSAFKKKQ